MPIPKESKKAKYIGKRTKDAFRMRRGENAKVYPKIEGETKGRVTPYNYCQCEKCSPDNFFREKAIKNGWTDDIERYYQHWDYNFYPNSWCGFAFLVREDEIEFL